MKQGVVIIILLFSSSLLGQINSSIDLLAGFNLTYRNLDGGGNSVGNAVKMTRDESEIRKSNIHIGFNYNKKIDSKRHFKTGLRYLSLGYQSKPITLTFADMSTTEIYFTYDYQFIEVPLQIRFDFADQKTLVPFAEIGLGTTYLLGNVQVLYQDGEEDTRTRNPTGITFNKLLFALNASAGLNYHLPDPGTVIYVQALMRYNVRSLYENNTLRELLFGYGVEVGVRRALSFDEN